MSKKIKIHPLFRKKYTEKQYQKKILKKLFVPADRLFIESLFIAETDPKKGHILHVLNTEAVTDAALAKKIDGIAKQIKKQKGRFNLVAVIAAVLCVLVVGLALTVFRNQIARYVLKSALEGAFGARADMEKIDFDLLHTRFSLENLTVANRKTPMKNLFSLGKTELDFNLLELSRGKLVAKNVEVTGITWNTDRTVTGALPPKKQKAFDKKQASQAKNAKPNPVSGAILNEVNKVKSGVSVDSGIASVLSQLDPLQFLENEKASLQSPAIIADITQTAPALYAKWDTKSGEVRGDVNKALSDGKKITALKIDSIKTVEEAQAALSDIQAAIKTTETTIAAAQDTASAVSADSQKIAALAKAADAAVKADGERIKNLANSVKSLNLESGKTLVSGVFNTFIVNTLGAYYPYAEKGLSLLRGLQSGAKKAKTQTLESKSKAIDRLPGRNFTFGKDSMPALLLEHVALSASDAASGLSGSAVVKNITDDADKLNKPMSIILDASHGKMAENVSGTIDLRSGAPVLLDSAFTGNGYPLSLSAGDQTGVPSIKGNLSLKGTFSVSNDETVRISSGILVANANATVAAFKPAVLYSAYGDILAGITEIRLDVSAVISPSDGLKLKVATDLDSVLSKAMQDQIAKQIEQFKAGIKREGDSYLAKEKQKYSAEIARFTDVASKSKAALDDIKNYRTSLEAKKTEAENRVKAIIAEKAAPVQKAANAAAAEGAKTVEKTVDKKTTDKIKKLF